MKTDLLETMGDDLMVANAARVSFGKRKTAFDVKDQKLLEFLSREGHTSPFRHPQLQFRIQCPIYIERQLFKHQVGATANSISGRYVDFSDTYDLPIQLRRQSSDSKQGSAGDLLPTENESLVSLMHANVELAKDLYRLLVDSGVSKEQARTILPLCLETTFIWTMSLSCFIHLCKLRLKPDAQQETRDVVASMLGEVTACGKFTKSLKVFGL